MVKSVIKNALHNPNISIKASYNFMPCETEKEWNRSEKKELTILQKAILLMCVTGLKVSTKNNLQKMKTWQVNKKRFPSERIWFLFTFQSLSQIQRAYYNN